MPAASDPSRSRMVVCAVCVALFAVGIWGYIERRSAAPPPPQVELPGAATR